MATCHRLAKTYKCDIPVASSSRYINTNIIFIYENIFVHNNFANPIKKDYICHKLHKHLNNKPLKILQSVNFWFTVRGKKTSNIKIE